MNVRIRRSNYNHGIEITARYPRCPYTTFERYIQDRWNDDGTLICPHCSGQGCGKCTLGKTTLVELRKAFRDLLRSYKEARREWRALLTVWQELRLTQAQRRAIDVFGTEGPKT